MQYYMIQGENEEVDEPWQLCLELDRQGHLLRKVEIYRVGLFQAYEDLNTPPMDPRELAGSDGFVSKITASQFESAWCQAFEPSGLSGGLMGML